MLSGLKITMMAFGAILGVEGILDIAFPVERAVGMGLGSCASHAQLPVTILGATWFVAGVWTVVAALNPLQHLNWVKFALTFPLVLLLVLAGAALRGHVPLRQVAVDIAFDTLFVLLFLVFYPHRKQAGAV